MKDELGDYGTIFADAENLPVLTDAQHKFVWHLLMDPDCKGSPVAAFVKAYPTAKDWTPGARSVGATRARQHPKIMAWVNAYRAANMDRLGCTLDEHVAELAKIRDAALAAGSWAAAAKAEELRGRAVGLYIDRKEITHKKQDDLARLVDLAKSGERELAARYAKELGVLTAFEAALESDALH